MSTPFSYLLSAERIAQRPVYPADLAKLLVLNRVNGSIYESTFVDLPQFLNTKDLLVFNDTRVVPARVFGKKGNLEVELLLLKDLGAGRWEAIGRPLRKLRVNDCIEFDRDLTARYLSRTKEDGLLVEFCKEGKTVSREEILAIGLMPIPPYIREGRSDQKDIVDYQTYFAKIEGSIAAPTASLHFTEELISKIHKRNSKIAFLTLHVGLASIREIEENSVPGPEFFRTSSKLFEQIKETKQSGGRVIAIGTTVVRALEAAALEGPGDLEKNTALFIKPGFKFQVVDAMVTNFHMPNSTHLLLVEAFIKSRELLATGYSYALDNDFRFLSYGDGMFIS